MLFAFLVLGLPISPSYDLLVVRRSGTDREVWRQASQRPPKLVRKDALPKTAGWISPSGFEIASSEDGRRFAMVDLSVEQGGDITKYPLRVSDYDLSGRPLRRYSAIRYADDRIYLSWISKSTSTLLALRQDGWWTLQGSSSKWIPLAEAKIVFDAFTTEKMGSYLAVPSSPSTMPLFRADGPGVGTARNSIAFAQNKSFNVRGAFRNDDCTLYHFDRPQNFPRPKKILRWSNICLLDYPRLLVVNSESSNEDRGRLDPYRKYGLMHIDLSTGEVTRLGDAAAATSIARNRSASDPR
jgi:hypothetical protein